MRGAAACAAGSLIGCALGLLAVFGPVSAATHHKSSSLTGIVIPNLGFGYAVVHQGPLDAGQFATSSPNPTAAAAALTRLIRSGSIATYERVWQDTGADNEVQDLVVRFTTVSGAQAYSKAVLHSLTSGEIMSSAPLPSIPGAYRTTYFAATTQEGVGQAITMRSGIYVATLSFFSSDAPSNTQRITLANAQDVANAQYAALVRAPGPPDKTVTTVQNSSALDWVLDVGGGLLGAALILWAWRGRFFRSSEPVAPAAPDAPDG